MTAPDFFRRLAGRRVSCLAACLAVASIAGSCSDYVVDPAHSHAGCTAVYNNDWQTYVRSYLAHSDSRTCPMGASVGDQVTSYAVVYDESVPAGTIGDAWVANLGPYSVRTSQHECLGSLGYPQSANFSLGPNKNGGAPYQWQAGVSVSWTRQTSPENLCFDVRLTSTVFQVPRAVIEISYNGSQY